MRPIIVIPTDAATAGILLLGIPCVIFSALYWAYHTGKDWFGGVRASLAPPFEWREDTLEAKHPGWPEVEDRVLGMIPKIIYTPHIDEIEGYTINAEPMVVEGRLNDGERKEHDFWELIAQEESPILWVHEAGASTRYLSRDDYREIVYTGINAVASRKERWMTYRVGVTDPLAFPKSDERRQRGITYRLSFREVVIRVRIDVTPRHEADSLDILEITMRGPTPQYRDTNLFFSRRFRNIDSATEIPHVNSGWFHEATRGHFSPENCHDRLKRQACEVLALQEKRFHIPSTEPPSLLQRQ